MSVSGVSSSSGSSGSGAASAAASGGGAGSFGTAGDTVSSCGCGFGERNYKTTQITKIPGSINGSA